MNPFHLPRVLGSCVLLLFLARPMPVVALAGAPGTQTQLELPTQVMRRAGGDFDVLKQRRTIRVLVVYNKTHFFLDKGQPHGLTYDGFKVFEDAINQKYKTRNLKLHVVFVPVSRTDLEQALLTGRGDIAAANLTVTSGRLERVDFASPVMTNVAEIVVSGPASEPIVSANDLSGKEVFVRQASSYHESLERLNADLATRGQPPVTLRFAPADLEDEDLLEMVHAGLVRYVVVDDYLARFWAAVLPKIKLHPEAALRTGAQIAWAIRKHSPLLKAELDAFLAKYPAGSTTRTSLFQQYLTSTKFVKDAASEQEQRKFQHTIEFFKTHAHDYNIDYLLMAAQGYQESQLDQNRTSPVGAIGIMQACPPRERD